MRDSLSDGVSKDPGEVIGMRVCCGEVLQEIGGILAKRIIKVSKWRIEYAYARLTYPLETSVPFLSYSLNVFVTVVLSKVQNIAAGRKSASGTFASAAFRADLAEVCILAGEMDKR